MNGLLHRVEITSDLTVGNDDAPAPGRLLVRCACPTCRQVHRFGLGPGQWIVEHLHGQGWTAQPQPDAATAPARELVSA